MNLGEATSILTRRVKRPDKVLEAESAINRAIGIFATSTFYQDMVELQVTLSGQEYVQAIDITASPFERFRKIKYIRPSGYRKYLGWRDPSRIWDHNCESTDVWYRAGNYIRFKLSNLQPTAELGYYQYHLPLVNPDDEDWMLNAMWPAVEAYALAELFSDIGEDADAAKFERRWPILLQAYKDDIGDGVSVA